MGKFREIFKRKERIISLWKDSNYFFNWRPKFVYQYTKIQNNTIAALNRLQPNKNQIESENKENEAN